MRELRQAMLWSVLVLTTAPGGAAAERFEHQMGVEGVAMFPRFATPDPTTFDNVSLGTRVIGAFGVTHDLYLVGRGTFWLQSGVLQGYEYSDVARGDFSGDLQFNGEGYRGELGVRWTVLSGYDLAPRLEAFGGYQWTTYRNPDLGDAGGSYGLEMEAFADGAATVGVGAVVDYRLANTMLVGVSASWVKALAGVYGDDVSVALTSSYYWF